MKRYCFVVAVLAWTVVLLVACGKENLEPVTTNSADPTQSANVPTDHLETTQPTSASTTDPTLATIIPPETTEPYEPTLPEYVPGSIKLVRQKADDYKFDRKYRALYYTIYAPFWELLDEEEMDDFAMWIEEEGKRTNFGEFREEMTLVSFVKRYDISREEFDRAVEIYIELGRRRDENFYHEDTEIPNADIIYTFDNEIINHYYRYE